jgi:hypothetical protein
MKPHLELVGNNRETSVDHDGLPFDAQRSAREECKRDATWRHSRVAIAAYYLSEHRGFQPGSEAVDWKLAELQIDVADEAHG